MARNEQKKTSQSGLSSADICLILRGFLLTHMFISSAAHDSVAEIPFEWLDRSMGTLLVLLTRCSPRYPSTFSTLHLGKGFPFEALLLQFAWSLFAELN